MDHRSFENAGVLLANRPAEEEVCLRALIPLVYEELRHIAHQRLHQRFAQHSLQTTELAHEAYLRMSQRPELRILNQAHFFALAALLMRQILIDQARRSNAAKREGGLQVTLTSRVALVDGKSVDLIALDQALQKLTRMDPQQAQVVELRYFGGLSVDESAEVLRISPSTVKRLWASARLWLYQQLAHTPERVRNAEADDE